VIAGLCGASLVKCGLALRALANTNDVDVLVFPCPGSLISACGEVHSQIPSEFSFCQPKQGQFFNSLTGSSRIFSRHQQILPMSYLVWGKHF